MAATRSRWPTAYCGIARRWRCTRVSSGAAVMPAGLREERRGEGRQRAGRRGEHEGVGGEHLPARAEPPRRTVARELADGRAKAHAPSQPPRERLDERAHAVRGGGEERVTCPR